MKAKLTNITFVKEVETKFGIMFKFTAKYDNDKIGEFLVKEKNKLPFVEGQEAEFQETEREYQGKLYYSIKPMKAAGNSNFSRQMSREQTKYSGFAMSYAKDLVIAEKIKLDEISKYTKAMFNLMVELDKTLQS